MSRLHIRVAEVDKGGFSLEAEKGGHVVGMIQVTVRGLHPRVSWIQTLQTAERQGIATALYQAAAQETCRRFESPLRSDTTRREGSEGFWQKQRIKGRARFIPASNQFELTCPAPESLAGLKRRRR